MAGQILLLSALSQVRHKADSLHFCVQIAIFVLPVVCLVGWATKHAFTLDLDPLSIIILTLSVIHACVTTSRARQRVPHKLACKLWHVAVGVYHSTLVLDPGAKDALSTIPAAF